jgi:DNA-binding transcriptional LysR family regulator
VERALAARGLMVRPTMSLGNTEAIKRAVASGVGIAIISNLAIGLEVRAKRLTKLRVSNLLIRRPLYRISLRGSSESRAVQGFNQLLDKAVLR